MEMKMKKHLLILSAAAVVCILLVAPAQADIVYVDAGDTNTAAVGGSPDPFFDGTSSSSAGEWYRRTVFGNGGDIFENGTAASPDDDTSKTLVTTINGLDAGAGYNVFAYFWSNDSEWRMQAGLSVEDMELYTANLAGEFDPATTVPAANAADFEGTVLVSEGPRALYQISLGSAVADSSGEISVFIDDKPGGTTDTTSALELRTWYDGVGYEPVPEPATLGLLALGGLAAAGGAARRRRRK